jgi:hypothetical protein
MKEEDEIKMDVRIVPGQVTVTRIVGGGGPLSREAKSRDDLVLLHTERIMRGMINRYTATVQAAQNIIKDRVRQALDDIHIALLAPIGEEDNEEGDNETINK